MDSQAGTDFLGDRRDLLEERDEVGAQALRGQRSELA
jgi:hypothetical protein